MRPVSPMAPAALLVALCGAWLPTGSALLLVPRVPRSAAFLAHRFVVSPRLCAADATGPDLISAADVPAPSAAALDPVDWRQIGKYPFSILVEFGLIAGCFRSIDSIVTLKAPFTVLIFLFLSLRSRVFSPLKASRPDRSAQEGAATPRDIKRPSWTPPGIAFPFIWITISVLRAASSLLVWRACGRVLFTPALLTLVLHLCVGDAWNCITNIERRLGVSAVGVLPVLASVLSAVFVYYRVLPSAGLLLAPSAVWISIASVLTWTIWAINEPRQSLLPRKGDGMGVALRVPLADLFEK